MDMDQMVIVFRSVKGGYDTRIMGHTLPNQSTPIGLIYLRDTRTPLERSIRQLMDDGVSPTLIIEWLVKYLMCQDMSFPVDKVHKLMELSYGLSITALAEEDPEKEAKINERLEEVRKAMRWEIANWVVSL